MSHTLLVCVWFVTLELSKSVYFHFLEQNCSSNGCFYSKKTSAENFPVNMQQPKRERKDAELLAHLAQSLQSQLPGQGRFPASPLME